mmetsp:Transcript_36143/g.79435  ORF Transcript_36143/g.79435 Transcript_36143/m.79435 type:complete len:154 (+) Transcript_36143:173-634(+)
MAILAAEVPKPIANGTKAENGKAPSSTQTSAPPSEQRLEAVKCLAALLEGDLQQQAIFAAEGGLRCCVALVRDGDSIADSTADSIAESGVVGGIKPKSKTNGKTNGKGESKGEGKAEGCCDSPRKSAAIAAAELLAVLDSCFEDAIESAKKEG